MFVKALIRALLWTARHRPARTFTGSNDSSPYLTRFPLTDKSVKLEETDANDGDGRSYCGYYLHHFHRSDDDGELHNHPWRWAISLVISGGYSEERRVGNVVVRVPVRPGAFNFLTNNTFHRVDLFEADAWTLIITGPRVQSWGFWDRDTKVFTHWREFLKRKANRAPRSS